MNIRVLLFTAGIAAVQVLSAIELTADSNRLEAGEAFVKMLVEYQEPGRAGTKCRWDFRGMQILSEELPVEYFIPDSSHMDILCGREGRNRYYYRQGSDSLWCVGHENATFYIDYARPELLLRYPFAYGDSLTSRFEGAGRYGQRIPLFVGGTTTVTADAEGELRLPGETFGNALRVHTARRYVRICEDSLSVSVDTYAWYVPQNRYPVFESETSTLHGTQADTILSAVSFYYPPDYLSGESDRSADDESIEEELSLIHI